MPISEWNSVIQNSSLPMTYASTAGILTSVYLGRWANVMLTIRAISQQRLAMEAQVAKSKNFSELVREHLEALEVETASHFSRARLLQGAIFCALASVFFSLLASFLEGLTPFEMSTKRVTASIMIGVIALIVLSLLLSGLETFWNLSPERARIERLASARELHSLAKEKNKDR